MSGRVVTRARTVRIAVMRDALDGGRGVVDAGRLKFVDGAATSPGGSRRAALVYTGRAEVPNVALSIEPITRPFDAVVELPGSKSYSNRALLVAALARGRSEVTRALFSDDTRYMHQALEALGVRVRADETSHAFIVDGV